MTKQPLITLSITLGLILTACSEQCTLQPAYKDQPLELTGGSSTAGKLSAAGICHSSPASNPTDLNCKEPSLLMGSLNTAGFPRLKSIGASGNVVFGFTYEGKLVVYFHDPMFRQSTQSFYSKIPSHLISPNNSKPHHAKNLTFGYGYGLFLKNNGTVEAWGQNGAGQLLLPSGLTDIEAISSYAYNNIALKKDGSIITWSRGYVGNVPYYDVSGLSDVTAIAAGAYHSIVLKKDGTVATLQTAKRRMLYYGSEEDFGQYKVPKGLKNVIAIASGSHHNLALTDDNKVVAWGKNTWDNNIENIHVKCGQATVPKGLEDVKAIAAGLHFSLALKNNGTVVSWGCHNNGDIRVPKGLKNVKAIAAGGFVAFALLENGRVVSWPEAITYRNGSHLVHQPIEFKPMSY